MIEVSVQGKNMEEIIDKLGAVIVATIPTEDLIKEARNRARKQGLEIHVEAPEAPEATPPLIKVGDKQGNDIEAITEPPKKRGPGRPPKSVESKVADALTASGGFPARENGKGKEEEPTEIDIQRIIDALNAYSSTHGGPASGRQVMQKVCGVTRLVDCPKEDYSRLLEALGA